MPIRYSLIRTSGASMIHAGMLALTAWVLKATGIWTTSSANLNLDEIFGRGFGGFGDAFW